MSFRTQAIVFSNPDTVEHPEFVDGPRLQDRQHVADRTADVIAGVVNLVRALNDRPGRLGAHACFPLYLR